MKIKYISLQAIPYDLEELLDTDGEIALDVSSEFETAMIDHNFLDYGYSRRSARVVSDKAKELGYFGVIEALTGFNEEEVKAIWKKELLESKTKQFLELAKELGYKVEKEKD